MPFSTTYHIADVANVIGYLVGEVMHGGSGKWAKWFVGEVVLKWVKWLWAKWKTGKVSDTHPKTASADQHRFFEANKQIKKVSCCRAESRTESIAASNRRHM